MDTSVRKNIAARPPHLSVGGTGTGGRGSGTGHGSGKPGSSSGPFQVFSGGS